MKHQILKRIFIALLSCAFVLGSVPVTAFAAADSSAAAISDESQKEDATSTESQKEDKKTTTATKKDDVKTTTTTKKEDEKTTTATKKEDEKTTTATKKEGEKTTTATKKDDEKTTTATKKDDVKTTTAAEKEDEKTTTATEETDKKEDQIGTTDDTPNKIAITAAGGIGVVLPKIGEKKVNQAVLSDKTLKAEILSAAWNNESEATWKENDTPSLTITLQAGKTEDKVSSKDTYYFDESTFKPENFAVYGVENASELSGDFAKDTNKVKATLGAATLSAENTKATFTITFPDLKKSEPVPPTDPTHKHDLKHEKAKDATCKDEGNIQYWYCEGCNKYFEDADAKIETTQDKLKTPKKPHTESSERKNKKDASCSEKGYSGDKVCSVCGEIIEKGTETPIDSSKHNLVYTNAKDPTCIAKGNIEYWYCKDCKNYFKDKEATKKITEKETELAIDSSAHSDFTHIAAKNPTCTENGNIEYWYCKGCKKYFKDSDAKNAITAQQTVRQKTGHSYAAPTFYWTNGRSNCTATFVCRNNSNHKETRTASVTHSVSTAATCTDKGTTKYVASVSFNNQTYTDTKYEKDIPMKEHNLELRNVKNATCTLEGYTGDRVCKTCGKTIVTGTKTSKIAHNYQNGKCTVCGAAANSIFNPKTGDNSRILFFTFILLLSVVGIAGILIYNKRRRA